MIQPDSDCFQKEVDSRAGVLIIPDLWENRMKILNRILFFTILFSESNMSGFDSL